MVTQKKRLFWAEMWIEGGFRVRHVPRFFSPPDGVSTPYEAKNDCARQALEWFEGNPPRGGGQAADDQALIEEMAKSMMRKVKMEEDEAREYEAWLTEKATALFEEELSKEGEMALPLRTKA